MYDMHIQGSSASAQAFPLNEFQIKLLMALYFFPFYTVNQRFHAFFPAIILKSQ